MVGGAGSGRGRFRVTAVGKMNGCGGRCRCSGAVRGDCGGGERTRDQSDRCGRRISVSPVPIDIENKRYKFKRNK